MHILKLQPETTVCEDGQEFENIYSETVKGAAALDIEPILSRYQR